MMDQPPSGWWILPGAIAGTLEIAVLLWLAGAFG
jgi:hypothetical protein